MYVHVELFIFLSCLVVFKFLVCDSAPGLVAVHSGLPVFMASAATVDDVSEQGITTIDNFNER